MQNLFGIALMLLLSIEFGYSDIKLNGKNVEDLKIFSEAENLTI